MTEDTAKHRCRIGIDVGGTFTDFVLADLASGRLTYYKEPSVPDDPSLSVGRGLAPLIERAGVTAGQVELILHGTTLLVNAIIQRRGARVALVVNTGFRDVLEIGRTNMPNAFDYMAQKEEPLVPRNLVFEVSGRVRVDGKALSHPDPREIAAIAARLKEEQVSAVSVMLLHSYLHPAMERTVAAQLRERLPGVLVTESAHIWPERREFERASVAIMNAYVHPLMDDYLHRLTAQVKALGIAAPIYITASNGGTLSIETARERPIDTILSGPASGVVAATRVATEAGQSRLITFDMGGTSSDIAVSKQGEPEYTTRTHVGGVPLIMPVINVSSIGAGGGSIIWVDAQGVLKMGPRSAGAEPGPVCYGRGADEPTVTDCYLALGLLDPKHFLGGRMTLDREAAARSLEAIADRLGFDGEDRANRVAEAALRVATAGMATELYKGLAERGEDPRQFTLMAFGGAGPTHANLLAEEARLTAIIVPPGPSTFCAMGAILTDVKRDYVRSQVLRFDGDERTAGELDAIFRDLEAKAKAWIETEGALLGTPEFTAQADIRYTGEAFELPIPIPDDLRRRPDTERISELFHREHEKIYDFRDLESDVEITTVRIRVIGRMPPISLPKIAAGRGAEPIARRRIYHGGTDLDVPVYWRPDFGSDEEIAGPAIVEQEDTTTWILPGWRGRVDHVGNLLIGLA